MGQKFNYQVVLKLHDDNRIIFTGVTESNPIPLISKCFDCLEIPLTEYEIENVVYQPVKSIENEKKDS